ncbi:hypothetical protein FQN57_005338 [Myotisia sp. PD_48]|nr:hypothetical protein FQN57_005338 [Myotisia sp. PD_48]
MRVAPAASHDELLQPTEASPLLGAQRSDNSQLGGQISGAPENDEEIVQKHGVDSARITQYEGIPELQKRLKYIIPSITVGVFLSAADQTIIVATYGKIGSDLNALNLTSWVATSYFLSLTSFQPLYGRLSDIFGRKSCLLFGYAVFGIGCVLCGLARNMSELIAARIFQGIGGGGMTTVVSIIMSDIVPLRDRGLWQGIINVIYAVGAGLGAPLAIGLTLPNQDQSDWRSKLRRIDFLGAVILVAAVFGLILGLDRGSNVSWSLPLTIISLSLSAVFFILFVFVEARIASEPFAPGHVIFNRNLLACFLSNFFSMGGWVSGLFYIPLFFQASDGVSAATAGLRLVPSIIFGVSGSLFGGYIMKKTGRYYRATVASYTLLTSGLLVIFLFSGIVMKSTTRVIIGTMMCSFGNGVGVTTTLIALIASASPEDQAVATACSYLFRSLGTVVTLALSATVIQQYLRSTLHHALEGKSNIDEIVDGVRQSLDYITRLDPATQAIVRECYGRATSIGFLFLTCAVFFALVSAVFIREQKLSR